MRPHTVTFIGDTGGNLLALQSCLAKAGVRGGKVPPGHLVVHVGDVVRCRPQFRTQNMDSMALVQDLAHANPDNFVVLLGNHEVPALGGAGLPGWGVPGSLCPQTVAIINDMWASGLFRLALAAPTSQWGDVLITHAGLTRARWQAIGSPTDPARAADLINTDAGLPVEQWSAIGRLVTGQVNPWADVTQAEPNLETYAPWLAGGDMPFTQVHGHGTPYDWSRGRWWPAANQQVQDATEVDAGSRRTVAELSPGAFAVCVDWTLGNQVWTTAPPWPLLSVPATAQLPVAA